MPKRPCQWVYIQTSCRFLQKQHSILSVVHCNQLLNASFLQAVTSDFMDIPPEYVSAKRYKASLAHKINHSFDPNCR